MAHTFIAEKPPEDTGEDNQYLNEYLWRMFQDVASNVEKMADGRIGYVRNVEPKKPREGMTAYADGTNWNPGNGKGYYVYSGSAWEQSTSAILPSLFDANTILKADTDDTPVALTVAEQTLLGRITAGVITALTPAQVRTLINVENGSTADQTDAEIKTGYEANADTNEFSDAEQTKLTNIEALAEVNDVVLLATANASASATVEFIDGTGGVVLDSTYKLYLVTIGDLVPATDATDLWLRLRDTTFQADAGDYQHMIFGLVNGSGSNQINNSDTKILLSRNAGVQRIGNASGESYSARLFFVDPAGTSVNKRVFGTAEYMTDQATTELWLGNIQGRYKTNQNAIDGFQFLMSSGNITSGEFKLYGLK